MPIRRKSAFIALLIAALAAEVLAAGGFPAPIRISPADADCALFYFQQCPESPDGRHVAYTAFRADRGGDVWICDPDGANARRIGGVARADRHIGAAPVWIDNQTVAFADTRNLQVHVVRIDTPSEKIFLGSIEEYSPANGKIIFCSRGGALPMGIYSLDPVTSTRQTLVTLDTVRPFAETMKRPFDRELWKLDHPYWSPDGTRFQFQIKSGGWVSKEPNCEFSFYAKADGSDIRLVGLKPMHVQWWDNESIYGHEYQNGGDKNLRRWSLDGKVMEHVAGYGCHGAVSPDRQWIATESWYSADPIVLRLYRRGQTKDGLALYTQPRMVDGVDFWKTRTHMHPAWSRDGKRLYFNARPAGGAGSQLLAIDLGAIVGGR